MVKGISLLSGGLDSRLAICVLREQGIEMEGIVFASPFFNLTQAKEAAEQLDVKLHVIDFTNDIIGLLRKPPHGFGGAMNPCIDCHALMIRRAGEFMRENGYDFVATGEVLNQRPMSQNRRSLDVVEKDSTLAGFLLRPLSAQLLPETIPETDGRVDRSKLLAIQGRCRKPQMELAKKYNFTHYPSPAGGCLLTEKGFCCKLKDLMDSTDTICVKDIENLKFGRHFRISDGTRCIVGRNRDDNQKIKELAKDGGILLHTVDVPGPSALIFGEVKSEEDLRKISGIVASYGDKNEKETVVVKIIRDGKSDEKDVKPLTREEFIEWML